MPTANANTGNGFSKAVSYALQEQKKDVPDQSRMEVMVDIPTKVPQRSTLKFPIYSGAKYASQTGLVSPPWKRDVVQT